MTVSETVVEWVADVPVPVIVSVYVPVAAVPASTVSVELAPAVTELGLKLALAPDGSPLSDRLTVWALPEVTAVEIVEVPWVPWASDSVDGLALIEKSFATGAVTVSETVVEWVADVPVPVIVSV